MGCLATLILLCSCSVWEAFFKGVMGQEYLELVRYVLENGAKKTDRPGTGTLPHYGPKTFFDLTFADITLHGYVHHPFIKFPIAV